MTALAELSKVYRAGQLRLRNTTVQELVSLWPVFDPRNANETFPAFASAAKLLIEQRRPQAAAGALGYLHAAKLLSGLTTPAPAIVVPPVDDDALAVSLRVTSLVAFKVGIRAGYPLEKASTNALVQVAGVVGRYVTDAGRDVVIKGVNSDPEAAGWRRLTSGNACKFCTMLAGRGAVYKDESTSAFRSHDHCGCTAEPVYRT